MTPQPTVPTVPTNHLIGVHHLQNSANKTNSLVKIRRGVLREDINVMVKMIVMMAVMKWNVVCIVHFYPSSLYFPSLDLRLFFTRLLSWGIGIIVSFWLQRPPIDLVSIFLPIIGAYTVMYESTQREMGSSLPESNSINLFISVSASIEWLQLLSSFGSGKLEPNLLTCCTKPIGV